MEIQNKLLLTIEEAVEYTGIGRDKIYELTNSPYCNFVLRSGKKRLIKRREFESFIESKTEI